MLNCATNVDPLFFEPSHKYANQLVFHANKVSLHTGTPPHSYLEWALIKNSRLAALILSRQKGTAQEDIFKAYDQLMAMKKV